MKDKGCNFPFSPARWPFFYGWTVLVFGALGILMSVPGQTMGVSAFTDHLLVALPLTRVQLSTAYMLGTIASALILTPAGKVYDRFGARIVAPSTAIALGIVLMGLSRADDTARGISHLLTGASPTFVAFSVMVGGFFLLRFFGQGVLTMVSRNMVMKWFDRRRGLANGLTGVVVAMGFSGAPLALDSLIRKFRWDGAWLALGLFIACVFSVVAFVFFRDNPEQCGLLPDGAPGTAEDRVSAHRQFTLPEARRTYVFWIFCLSLAMFALYVTAFTFHIVSLFKSAGMERREALGIFLPVSILAVSVHLTAGWLSDRIPLKVLLITMLAALTLSMAAVAGLAPGLTVGLLIVGNGVGGGLFGLLSAITWPTFFGREHLGAVAGLSLAVAVFHSAIGPWVFSQSFALTGSYRGAAMACVAITVLLLIGAFKADNPQHAPRRSP